MLWSRNGKRALEAEGFAHYVAQLRAGSSDPYLAYRVYEQAFKVARKDAGVVRRATIRLIEADPWFLATALPHFLAALHTTDLERLTAFVGVGPARRAAAMLRAILWYQGRRGPYHPDAAGRRQLRKALAYLRQVPAEQRDLAWHEMLVGCYRVLDYGEYTRAFPRLLQLTSPEWRAHPLENILNVAAARKDWKTYDEHRAEWDRLPVRHHSCECYLNSLYTNDGLRAAAAGNWDAIPDALSKAATVRGCPHLNSGAVRLDLVRLLLSKRRQLGPAREYLDRVAAFERRNQEISKLRSRLDDIDTRLRTGG